MNNPTLKFTTLGEPDISGLVYRLYNISGPSAAELAEKARKALLEANPQLGRISSLRRGSVLVVPEIPGISLAAEASADAVIGAEVLDELRRVLSETKKHLEDSIDREAQDLQNTLAAMEDPELRRSADQFPEVSPQLERISEQTKKDLDGIGDAKLSLNYRFDVFEREFKNLLKRVT
jgi:hypothetical protein